MASRSVFLPSQLLAEKGKFWNPTLSDIMCSRIKKTLNQNCWSWKHFSQEKIPHPLIPVVIYLHYRKYAVPIFLGHPVYIKKKKKKRITHMHITSTLYTFVQSPSYFALKHVQVWGASGFHRQFIPIWNSWIYEWALIELGFTTIWLELKLVEVSREYAEQHHRVKQICKSNHRSKDKCKLMYTFESRASWCFWIQFLKWWPVELH